MSNGLKEAIALLEKEQEKYAKAIEVLKELSGDGGWIDWDYSSKYPDLPHDTIVLVQMVDGETEEGEVAYFEWSRVPCLADIVKYKILEEA